MLIIVMYWMEAKSFKLEMTSSLTLVTGAIKTMKVAKLIG